jgi:STAS-like domain of unknown function (DUF4325)
MHANRETRQEKRPRLATMLRGLRMWVNYPTQRCHPDSFLVDSPANRNILPAKVALPSRRNPGTLLSEPANGESEAGQAMKIHVSRDFSDVPAGRYRSDGPFSGEAFREDHLWPALRSHEQVSVDLDGTEGYGSSFLEEAFGGLVRKGYLSGDELHKRLDIQSSDPSFVKEIFSYIDAASKSRLRP